MSISSSVHEAALLASEAPDLRSSLPYALVDFDKSQIIAPADSGTLEVPVWTSEHNGRRFTYQFDVTRPAELRIRLYLPTAPSLGNGRCADPFSGELIILPSFKKYGNQSAEWLDLYRGTGAVRMTVHFAPNSAFHLQSTHFELLSIVQERSALGMVMQVRYVLLWFAFLALDYERVYRKWDTGQLYLLGTLPKNTPAVIRLAATQIDSPFIVPLKFAFQSRSGYYRLLSVFIGSSRLFYRLESEHHFDLPEARFYTAQLVLALACLHDHNIVYRDLRPETIFLDLSGYLLIADFALFLQDPPCEAP